MSIKLFLVAAASTQKLINFFFLLWILSYSKWWIFNFLFFFSRSIFQLHWKCLIHSQYWETYALFTCMKADNFWIHEFRKWRERFKNSKLLHTNLFFETIFFSLKKMFLNYYFFFLLFKQKKRTCITNQNIKKRNKVVKIKRNSVFKLMRLIN